MFIAHILMMGTESHWLDSFIPSPQVGFSVPKNSHPGCNCGKSGEKSIPTKMFDCTHGLFLSKPSKESSRHHVPQIFKSWLPKFWGPTFHQKFGRIIPWKPYLRLETESWCLFMGFKTIVKWVVAPYVAIFSVSKFMFNISILQHEAIEKTQQKCTKGTSFSGSYYDLPRWSARGKPWVICLSEFPPINSRFSGKKAMPYYSLKTMQRKSMFHHAMIFQWRHPRLWINYSHSSTWIFRAFWWDSLTFHHLGWPTGWERSLYFPSVLPSSKLI